MNLSIEEQQALIKLLEEDLKSNNLDAQTREFYEKALEKAIDNVSKSLTDSSG